jgi:type I restriction enzyme S subunit
MNRIEAPLGELITYIGKGIVPSYTENESTHDAVMVLGQRCVRNYAIDYSQARFHDKSAKAFRDEKRVVKGDILVNATGVGSAGRVAQIITEP